MYLVQDLEGVLCYKCAKKYITKTIIRDLDDKIDKLKEEKRSIIDNLNRSCPHEHFEDAGSIRTNGNTQWFHKCLDCGITFYTT